MTYIITDQDVVRAMEVLGPPKTLAGDHANKHFWRSMGAKEGWKTRRAGMTPWRRYLELRPRVENAPARLMCCDLAEMVLPAFTAEHPDDPRPQWILWTARRYAHGLATDRERLAMHQIAIAITDEYVVFPPRTRAERALYAVCFCLQKDQSFLLQAVLQNVEEALGEDRDVFTARVLPLLEAMPLRPRKSARGK